jgi:hypothetical protein
MHSGTLIDDQMALVDRILRESETRVLIAKEMETKIVIDCLVVPGPLMGSAA